MSRRDWFFFAGLLLALGHCVERSHAQPPSAQVPVVGAAESQLAWAIPLKGGPVRVSAVYPEDGAADLAALARCVDVRLTAHPFIASDAESFDAAVAAAIKGKYHVLLVSSGALADLSPATREALAARLQAGVGLLWLTFAAVNDPSLTDFLSPIGIKSQDSAPDFAASVGGAALTGLRPGFDSFTTFAGGDSRVAQLGFWAGRPHGHALVPLAPLDALESLGLLENYLALAGRALLWASHRDPEVTIARIEDRAAAGPQPVDTPPQLPGRFIERMREAAAPAMLRQYAVVLDRPAPRALGLRIQARYPDRGIRWSYEPDERIVKGGTESLVGVPLGNGKCFVDVWLLDGEHVVDWRSEPLALAVPPRIDEANFGRAVVEPNDRLTVSALVHGRLQAAQPSVASMHSPVVAFLRATDHLGREIARRDVVLPAAGGDFVEELTLVDLLGPYARAEIFAAILSEPSLTWWARERADYRAANLIVRQPLPSRLSVIVEEPGEGSFAGSARRRALVAQGADFIFPGTEPDLGNIAADGARVVANLGDFAGSAAETFGAGARPGIALREAARRYASLQPGLYVVSGAAGDDAPGTQEEKRLAIENAVRESDPRAIVALLDGDYSAGGTRGFHVLAPSPTILSGLTVSPREFVAIRTPLESLESARWLPWLAAVHAADAVWVAASDTNPEALDALMAESQRVRDGFDTLLRHARPSPKETDPALKTTTDFAGIVRRFELGKASVYAFLADPADDGKAVVRLKVEGDDRIHEITAAAPPLAVRNLTVRLLRGQACVAVVLPYEVTRVAVDTPASVTAGRRLTIRASVKTRGTLPGDHVVRFDCFDPRGRRLEHYGQNVAAPNGAAVAWLPVAYSDVPGVYRIVARDVLSGAVGEAEVMVLPAERSRAVGP